MTADQTTTGDGTGVAGGSARITRADWKRHVADENADFAAFLSSLHDQDWAVPSLCAGWSVHEVVAHIAAGYAIGIPRSLAIVARHGFRLNRASAAIAPRWAAEHAPGQTLEVMLSGLRGGARMPGVNKLLPHRAQLADHFLHQQDCRYPLGRPRAIPADRLHAVLVALSLSTEPLPARRRLRGLRLIATDIDVAIGRGSEVRRPLRLPAGTGGSGTGGARLTDRRLRPVGSTMMALRAAIHIGAAALVVGLSGCASSSVGPSAGGGSSATPGVAAGPTAPSGSASLQGPLPAETNHIAAGSYTTATFEPHLVLTLPDTVWGNDEELKNFLVLYSQGGDADKINRCTLLFISPPQVYDPVNRTQLDPTPPSLVDWLKGHPFLHVVKEGPVSVGGIAGVAVDLMADPAREYPDYCFGRLCKYLFPGGEHVVPVGVTSGSQFRLIVLKVGGAQLVVYPEAPPQTSPHCDFGIYGPQQDQLLQSVRIVPAVP